MVVVPDSAVLHWRLTNTVRSPRSQEDFEMGDLECDAEGAWFSPGAVRSSAATKGSRTGEFVYREELERDSIL